MGTVLDYSGWRPPSPQALIGAGVVGVMRYIAPAAWQWPKAITPAELAGLRAAGVAVGFNFEKNPTDYLAGSSGGIANGQAIATAMAELGVPGDVPVFVSYDTDVPPAMFERCLEYHRSVMSQTHGRPIDGYGENALLEFLAGQGVLSRGWMSESLSFPGNAAPTAHTVLQQHWGQQVPGLSGAYDVNTTVQADWGQYPRPSAPIVSSEEEPMLYPSPSQPVLNKFRGARVDCARKQIQLLNAATCSPAPTISNPNAWVGSYAAGPGVFVVVTADTDEYKFTLG